MKKLKLVSTAIIASAFFAQAALADSVKYQIESNHAFVLWQASHFGFSKQVGKFSDLSGEILFDEKNPQASSVNVTIKTDALATGLPKFDNHLKSADFLDVDKYPTAQFVSKKIKVTGKNRAKIEGDLTLRGITKSVVLDAKLNKIGTSVVTQRETIGFNAVTSIKRSDFGISYGVPGVSDQVDLVIEVEANK